MMIARLCLPFALLLAPAAASAQSLLGEWIVTAEAPGASVFEEVSVSKDGDSYVITGKLVGDVPPGMANAGPAFDIVIDGDSFSYKRTAETGQGSVTVTYSGTVMGDRFEGFAEVGGYKVPYSGERTAAAAAPGS